MTIVPDQGVTANGVKADDTLVAALPVAREERTRYAVQRMVAAERGRLHERMLLQRARSEGLAHRRARPAREDLQ